tara:strand:- start:953 stop:1441 length:489 start_codon:yes stop_codon:yes gene_type:complete
LNNRKGISPLIATVLLIGLVVAVVASIMLWSRTIIKEEIEKRAPIAQGKLTCQTEVGIDVEEVCIPLDTRRIRVKIRNTKDRIIPKVRGRVIDDEGKSYTEDWSEKTITGFERKTIYFGFRSDFTPKFIEIIPIIFQEGDGGAVEVVCNNYMVRSTELGPCI